MTHYATFIDDPCPTYSIIQDTVVDNPSKCNLIQNLKNNLFGIASIVFILCLGFVYVYPITLTHNYAYIKYEYYVCNSTKIYYVDIRDGIRVIIDPHTGQILNIQEQDLGQCKLYNHKWLYDIIIFSGTLCIIFNIIGIVLFFIIPSTNHIRLTINNEPWYGIVGLMFILAIILIFHAIGYIVLRIITSNNIPDIPYFGLINCIIGQCMFLLLIIAIFTIIAISCIIIVIALR